MPEHTSTPRRKNIRLRHFDYSQRGAYFVTICTHDRERLLGDVVDDQVRLNDEGRIVLECWHNLPNHYEHVKLDEFVVMPNHVHGIIVITDPVRGISLNEERAGLKPAPTSMHSLSEIVRGFKTLSSRRINRLQDKPGQPVWQRSFYEHVIRDEKT